LTIENRSQYGRPVHPESGVGLPTGVRMTPQRKAVIAAVATRRRRFTVAELHGRARRSHPGLGLATTYRTLELLREAGAVRVLAGETPTYIRCRPEHHHHLVCTSCGTVQETDLCAAPAADELERTYGFSPQSHEFEVYGLCRTCA
jgi:Fur family ferric uptake transcriptional regulator